MKFLKLAPRQQIIVMAAVFIVVLLLLIILFVVPQIFRVIALSGEAEAANQELISSKSTYSQLEQLKKTSLKTDNELIRQTRQVPDTAELPALLIQIEDISTKSGINLLSIKPSAPVQKDDFQEIPLELTIDGYFYSLLDFTYRLEKLPRIISVTSLDIKEGALKLPNIETTVKASAYILTPGVKSTKGSAPATGATTSTPSAGQGTTSTTTGSTTGGGGTPQ